MSSPATTPPLPDAPRPVVGIAVTIAVLAGLAAAWLAAGSAGLMAHSLRHALAWVALGIAGVAAWPGRQRDARSVLTLLAAAGVALGLSITAHPVPNVLAVAVVLAGLAQIRNGQERRVLTLAAFAATVLAAYRLAVLSIPAVWLLTDWLGGTLGAMAGWLSGRPLAVGATFAGLDFLVLTGAFYGAWLGATQSPRWPRAVFAAVAILLGHMVYLVVLSFAPDLAAALPTTPPLADRRAIPPWSWSAAAGAMLPWNLPLVALAMHLGVLGAMVRWAAWREEDAPLAATRPRGEAAPLREVGVEFGPVLLAAILPLITVLSLAPADLTGARIAAYGEGPANWDKPEHGRHRREEMGRYGMLPELVASLGGRFNVSKDLGPSDLAEADVLVLLHPSTPWPQDRLDSIAEFVERGGSLLVAAGQPTQQEGLTTTVDDLLRDTGIRVRFDSALGASPAWQEALAPVAHPAATGIGDQRDRFGLGLGPSIELQWPARPVLAGTWGYSEPGVREAISPETATEDGPEGPRRPRYEAGERLGDLVLAAERPWGRGTIVALADAHPLANESLPLSYPFAGRLLGYLAGRTASPQAWWRQGLGLVACGLLIGLLAWRPRPAVLAGTAVVLALSLGACTYGAQRAGAAMPDGEKLRGPAGTGAGTRLAYIDASHMEGYSEATWGPDGLGGFMTALMQNGYLPLLAPDLSKERLERASLLVSISPARPFSDAEVATVADWVARGGILIAMAGAEDAAAVQALVKPYDLRIARSPVGPGETAREPEPHGQSPKPGEEVDQYGRKAMPYFNPASRGLGDYAAVVPVHSGWPIACDAGKGRFQVLLRGYEDIALVIDRFHGQGRAVLIGDPAFATNKNYTYLRGEPTDDAPHSAAFWRWLLSIVGGGKEWIPTDPTAVREPAEKPSPSKRPPPVRKAPAAKETGP